MISEFLFITAALTAIIAARYLVISGLVYWLLWKRGGEKLRAKHLNRDRPMRPLIIEEIRLSLLSSVMYAAPAAVATVSLMHGGTRIYNDWTAYGGAPELLLRIVIPPIFADTSYFLGLPLTQHPMRFPR